jgi:hypothetical protein
MLKTNHIREPRAVRKRKVLERYPLWPTKLLIRNTLAHLLRASQR